MDLDYIYVQVNSFFNIHLFEVNKTPVTLASIFMFVLGMILFLGLSRFLNRVVISRLLNRFQIDSGMQYTMLRVNHYAIMTVGAIVSFQFIGIDLSGLAVIFGLLSVGIGFGLQNVTSNFIAGLILLFERPIKIGDRILVGETEGDVVDINIRSTTIRSVNNISIIVPNSEFVSGRVVNWSHGETMIRVDVEVGVSYNSDLDKVLATLKEVAHEHPEVLKNPEPDVLLKSFGDSSWNMKLRVWIDEPRQHPIITSDLNCAIVNKFREHNIEIPFPQRDLHLRSAEPLPVHKTTVN